MTGMRRFLGAWAVALVVLLAAPSWAAHVDIEPGEVFPDLEFYGLVAPEDYLHLGLPRTEGPFKLSEVPGEYLVLEFFNRSCVPCQRQVRQLEWFYRKMRSRGTPPPLQVLAVAAGNNPKYLAKYKQRRKLTFPITADPQFDQWRRLGEPGRTPFTVYLTRNGKGRWTLRAYFFGVQQEGDLMAHAEQMLRGELAAAHPAPGEVPPRPLFLPRISPHLERELVRRLLSRVAGREVGVERVPLDDVRLYRAVVDSEELDLYAKVAYRDPVCEVCHSVQFLFAFDGQGRLRAYDSIHVTKYDNEEWTEEDSRFLESRLVDRTLEGLSFDPEVDAVARATMSSALIFDDVRRTAALLKALKSR
ncbi:MAG: hypothetical protein Kow0092_02580 [Deferrisomatales bacterium]